MPVNATYIKITYDTYTNLANFRLTALLDDVEFTLVLHARLVNLLLILHRRLAVIASHLRLSIFFSLFFTLALWIFFFCCLGLALLPISLNELATALHHQNQEQEGQNDLEHKVRERYIYVGTDQTTHHGQRHHHIGHSVIN